ncbi:hypothetical protein PNOK_0682300 [Pyrrhoderma noxium]|uniref:Uncharacterized protein n=1 Tax=Pyrrhoderma noxium TaxID=2282107 RepID=A0A286UFI0_9AGAM|nr:hypothetical protein PNOK_0682300 [Pyrrhoderma noxium]
MKTKENPNSETGPQAQARRGLLRRKLKGTGKQKVIKELGSGESNNNKHSDLSEPLRLQDQHIRNSTSTVGSVSRRPRASGVSVSRNSSVSSNRLMSCSRTPTAATTIERMNSISQVSHQSRTRPSSMAVKGKTSNASRSVTRAGAASNVSLSSSSSSSTKSSSKSTIRAISIASDASINSIVPEYEFPELPYGWKEVELKTEEFTFKNVMYIIVDHYEGGRLSYFRDQISEISEKWKAQFDHPSRTVYVEKRSGSELAKELVRQLEFLEVTYKPGTMYEPLFKKLREVDPNGVLLFREDKERISYHNKKWYLQARYKGTSWMVANNKIKHSIRDMLSHFEHKEIRFKPHPNIDTSNPVWKKLQNLMIHYYGAPMSYGGTNGHGRCRLFYRKIRDEKGREKFFIRVADIKEKIIFEHSGATLDEAADKLEKVMDTYKSEKADMLMFFPYEKPDHHIGRMEVQDESWCRVTLEQQNIEDGIFKPSLYKMEKKKMNAALYYARNRNGWLIRVVTNDASGEIVREWGQTLVLAEKKVYYSLDFKEIISQKNSGLPKHLYDRLKEGSKGAKLFIRKDTSKLTYRKDTYIIKIQHATSEFRCTGRTKLDAVQKMIEHLTFREIPTHRRRNLTMFQKFFVEDKAEPLDKVLDLMQMFGGAKLFYKFEGNQHVFKVEHPVWGLRAQQKNKNLVTVLKKLFEDMKTVIQTTGQNMLLEVNFASANKIFSSEFPKINKWILANVDDYDRVFRPLISELYNYEGGKENLCHQVFYMNQDLIWCIKIVQTNRITGLDQILISEQAKRNSTASVIIKILREKPTKFFGKVMSRYCIIEISSSLLGWCTKIVPRNQADISGRPIWNQIFKEMRWYGDCGIFQQQTIKRDFIIKIDHPYWGLQFKMKSKLKETVEEEILKVLRRDRDKACVEFIYDKKTWLNILNQPKEERAREGVVIDQYALTTSENYVFRDLFKFCRKKLEHEPNVWYTNHDSICYVKVEVGGKTIVKRAAVYELACSKLIYELGFRPLTVESKDLALKHVDKSYIRDLEKVLEKKCKEKNVKVSYRFLKKDERFTDGPYKVPEKGGYVVRVEHEKLGFQYTDESLNAAIRLMVDHLHYTEITYKNIPKENNTQWHHVLDVLNSYYGYSKLLAKKSYEGDVLYCFIKVVHHRKGKFHQEKADSFESALKKMLKKLTDGKTSAGKDRVYAFDNAMKITRSAKITDYDKALLKGVLNSEKEMRKFKQGVIGVTTKK